MLICAVSRPDPLRDFESKVRIWGVRVIKAQRTTACHEKGDEYVVDITKRESYELEVLPVMKENIP